MGSQLTWLTQLTSELSLSSQFLEIFESQLVDHARQIAAVDLRDGKHALLPPDQGFQISFQQIGSQVVGSVSGYLVGPDGFGEPVTAIWLSPDHPQHPIDPRQAEFTLPSSLQVVWSEFPIESTKTTQEPTPITSETRLAIMGETSSWPDVHLDLQSHSTFTDSEIVTLGNHIDSHMEHWNTERQAQGLIHYRGEIIRKSETDLTLHMDFGSAPQEALFELLGELDRSSELANLSKVVIR